MIFNSRLGQAIENIFFERDPVIKKKDIIKDTFVDGVLKELREFKKHRKTREEKNTMQESLIKTLKKQGYESFLGTEIEFATSQIGKSYLFNVPNSRHGALSKFRGKQIRVVCAERVDSKVRYMIAAVGHAGARLF